MAEVATKKSINVVSNGKKSEVCGVQSNNGLIDLDNLTASNNQLITLCESSNNDEDEDGLILTNNTRNELSTEDKSLQELIESELALRICSTAEAEQPSLEAEDRENAAARPETVKRIVLDRRQDTLDVNTEFIVTESEECSLLEESYNYQNGHASPGTKTSYVESIESGPGPVVLAEEEVEQRVIVDRSEVGSATAVEKTTSAEIVHSSCETGDDGRLGDRVEGADRTDEAVSICEESRGQDLGPFYSPARAVEEKEEEQNEEVPGKISGETTTARSTSDPFSFLCESKEAKEEKRQEEVPRTISEETPMAQSTSDPFYFLIESKEVEEEKQNEEVPEKISEETAMAQSTNEPFYFVTKTTEEEEEKKNEEVPGKISEETAMAQSTNEPFYFVTKTTEEEEEKKNEEVPGKIPEETPTTQSTSDPFIVLCESKEPKEEKLKDQLPQAISAETPVAQSRIFDDCQLEAASTQDFIDTERRVLSEEAGNLPEDCQAPDSLPEESCENPGLNSEEDDTKEEANDNAEDQNLVGKSSSEPSVSEPTFIEKTEVIVSETNVTILTETKCVDSLNDRQLDSWTTVEEATKMAEDSAGDGEEQLENEDNETAANVSFVSSSPRAPLATPDDEISDVSNACDSESREETITRTTAVTSTKGGAKTKKKKIEGVAGNDASANLTPRTKKTKKSKKSELEKENISVNSNLQDASMHAGPRESHPEMIDFSDEDDLSNVNVKSLTQNYVSEASRNEQERTSKERIATGVSIKQLCRSFGDISNMSDGDQTAYGKVNHTMETDEKSSFNKFDALTKKTVLHVRSVDAGKVQQQLNAVGQNGDSNPNCRSCGKVVFQMEQTKAEGLVWHKNCFRCVQCSKQLNVDNYESHESTLYCKPHFKELFQPKPVEESDQPVRVRKPELIIRENEPKELPPDVVRASDKPDLGLEELSSLNVKSRFQVFEKSGNETNEIERSPSQIAVKRSPSILSKLAKFQAKGMDIGVADESLNGIPYEESSESEEEEEPEETEDVDTEIVKAKRATRERPISFSKMDDIKNRWESTSQQGRREVQREARKEEIAGIRSRLFMGKQGKMKEMYQQAVAGSERVTKINAAEEIQHSTHARSIKERFERGEPIAASDDETDSKPKPEKADEEVIAAGISRKSRSLFLELDATAAKTGRPVTPVNPKTPAEAPRRARDAFMGRQVSDDVVRSTDATEEVQVETSDISNKFKFFESYKEPAKQRKQFRITPPRDGQVKMDSPDREIYRDPEVVRADDRVNEVVHTDTARKMLSIFRQMEENACKKEAPNGPKPLKRFTPPPEDKFAKPTASDSEEDEEDEGEESEGEDSAEERDPNYVRASDKVEDEFLKQAQTAARAKTLCAKFEHWEETDGKVTSNQHIAEMEMAQGTGEQSSIESASSLRARFESLGSQTNESPRTPKVKVNRFVEIQTTCMDVCESCEKKVYPLEKVETNNKIFHKQCFRCLQCNCILRMDTFTLNNGKLYCIPHFKQLFITRGNYDEGFGVDPHKNKWTTSSGNNSTSPSPIAVSNGDL